VYVEHAADGTFSKHTFDGESACVASELTPHLVKSRHCVDGQVAAVATTTLAAVAQRASVGVARRAREAVAVVNHVVALAARAIPALDGRAAIDVSAAGDVGVDVAHLTERSGQSTAPSWQHTH
jgi:hypothetical protein